MTQNDHRHVLLYSRRYPPAVCDRWLVIHLLIRLWSVLTNGSNSWAQCGRKLVHGETFSSLLCPPAVCKDTTTHLSSYRISQVTRQAGWAETKLTPMVALPPRPAMNRNAIICPFDWAKPQSVVKMMKMTFPNMMIRRRPQTSEHGERINGPTA